MTTRIFSPLFVRRVAASIAATGVLALPAIVSAQGLVTCSGGDCDFNAFIRLIQGIIDFFLIMIAPLASIMFAWAGWLYLSSAGNSGQVSQATKIFKTVGIGLVLALIGWLVIKTITDALLKPGISPLS